MEILGFDKYHTPQKCKECGGAMIFRGVGEYQCENCGALDYDDYGRVRLYLEAHRGANATEVEAATGVAQRTIRNMLKDEKLEVAANSKVFLVCEICKASITSGRWCAKCEQKHKKEIEAAAKENRVKSAQGFGMSRKDGEAGEKRFRRR